MRGFIAGAFALIVLQVLVANPKATGALTGVSGGAVNAVNWFLDPGTPAIPDRKPAKTDATLLSASPPLAQTLATYTGPSSVPAGVQ